MEGMIALAPSNEADLARALNYITAVRWKWAKTYAQTFPHWYTVREWKLELDDEFCWFAQLIRDNGVPKPFFEKIHIYLDLDGWKYWTMGNPIPETTVINREEIIRN